MLHYDLLNDILNLSGIRSTLIMEVRVKERHDYKIYQGKDGWWYTYIKDETKKTGRRQLKRREKAQIIDYLEHLYEFSGPTVEEVFNEWNNRRLDIGAIKNSTFTRNQYFFKKHFGKIARLEISKINPLSISDFLEEQLNGPITAATFARIKSLLRGLLKRAKKRGLIFFGVDDAISDTAISDHSFIRNQKPDEEEVFFDDEMEMILDYCKAHQDDVMCLGVALMFVSGMRVGEVVALTGIDISDGTVTVTKTETRFLKDDKLVYDVSNYPKTPSGFRQVIIPDHYMWILDKLRERGDKYIFIGRNGNRLHTQAIRKRLYQICKKMSFRVRSPHKIRKTYGSILLDNALDDKLIQRQMGHSNIECTRTHYYKDRKDLDQKRQLINSVKQFE